MMTLAELLVAWTIVCGAIVVGDLLDQLTQHARRRRERRHA